MCNYTLFLKELLIHLRKKKSFCFKNKETEPKYERYCAGIPLQKIKAKYTFLTKLSQIIPTLIKSLFAGK